MKKFTFLFILAIGFTSCSVESMDSTENLMVIDAKAPKALVVTSVDYDETVCFGDEANFTFNFPQAYNANNKEQKTLVILELWNEVSEEWIEIHQGNYEGAGPQYFSYDFGAEGTYLLQHRIGTGNNWTAISVTVEDCSTCENLLVADLGCGEVNTLTLTFTAVEAGAIVIQGGLTNGTIITSATSDQLTIDATHSSVLNSKASVTRWEGVVDACEIVTITIKFEGGNGIGDWSAKRGDDVLGETEEQSCNN